MEVDSVKNIEKFIQNFLWKSIFISLLFLILGIVLVIDPNMSVFGIAYVVGVVLIINGISYMIESNVKLLFYDPLLVGIISLIFGIIVIVNPDIFTVMIPIVLGIWFIIYGVIKYKFSLVLNEIGENGWAVSLLGALITMFSGILLMVFPKVGAVTLVFMIGVLLIVYSISDIINFFIIKKRVNDIVKYFK